MEENKWGNAYEAYTPFPPARDSDELDLQLDQTGLFPFYYQNQKHIRGKQECVEGGTQVTVTLTDEPRVDMKGVKSIAGKNISFQDISFDRRLSFYIAVESGPEAGATKKVRAQQFIRVNESVLDTSASYFVSGVQAQAKKNWPGDPKDPAGIAFPPGEEVYETD